MREDEPPILISAVSGDIGYSVVQALQAKAFRIIGCDLKPYTPVRHLLDNFYEVPPATDPENYFIAIKKIINEERLQFFLPISEPEIALIHNRREEFTDLNIKLLLNNRLILDTFLNKMKTVRFLSKIGIKVPKTSLLHEYQEHFEFPVIVKSLEGYGSNKLCKVDNKYDLEYIKRKYDSSYIIQECIGTPEEEYTTGVFSDGKNISSISFRRKLGVDGTTLEAILVHENRLHELSCKIAEATSLTGSINIQSRRLEDIFIPFEINPRISGTILFRKQFGFDDVSWWIDMLSNKEYHYKPLYKSGMAFRYYSQYYYGMERIESI